MNILSIGNSFAQDTMEHLPLVAKDLGVEGNFAFLYIPGCPIAYHYLNAMDDLPVYLYRKHAGADWVEQTKVRISQAIADEKWDWINIQHGSKDNHCYTDPIFYKHLDDLVCYIRQHAGKDTKISFNMAWVADPEKEHHEMVDLYGNDQEKMFAALVALTRELVEKTPGIDRVSPTGAAVQIARRSGIPELTRDGYHVSYGFGRYMAALTFLKALTGVDISKVRWAPEGVTDQMRNDAVRCAMQAVEQWQADSK